MVSGNDTEISPNTSAKSASKVIVIQKGEELSFRLVIPRMQILTGILGFLGMVDILGRDSIDNIVFNGEVLNEQGIQKFWLELDRIFKTLKDDEDE
jgi:hypothetical protein